MGYGPSKGTTKKNEKLKKTKPSDTKDGNSQKSIKNMKIHRGRHS
jgi:hypothetical protein